MTIRMILGIANESCVLLKLTDYLLLDQEKNIKVHEKMGDLNCF